ncbi:MAG TPA: GvpL/GvpF family gas vesicle protein [Candidatus Eisenbacteria bacterium]|nr:GvpL/GvpF family gas vesicle protein [Candidatus Eisenbacteria bacterium]
MMLSAIVDEPPAAAEVVQVGALRAVLLAEDDDLAPDEMLLRQAGLVASLMDTCTAVLPVRAGSRVRDCGEAGRLLRARYAELREGLDRVRGCVELGVRASGPGGSRTAEAPQDGRAYLAARARAWRWADGLSARLTGLRGEPGVRDVALLACTPATVKASLLVEKDRLESARGAVRRLEQPGEGELVLSGPFAPYSFVPAPPEGGRHDGT